MIPLIHLMVWSSECNWQG